MATDKNQIAVDVRAFIQWFGGPSAMRQKWEKSGLVLTKGAQDKWVMRNTIPTARLIEAANVAKRLRIEFDVNRFFVKKKKAVR